MMALARAWQRRPGLALRANWATAGDCSIMIAIVQRKKVRHELIALGAAFAGLFQALSRLCQREHFMAYAQAHRGIATSFVTRAESHVRGY